MELGILALSWTFKYDLIFELIFAVISLMLAIFAFKLFKITEEHKLKLFSISFLLISISYFVLLFCNLSILEDVSEPAIDMDDLLSINVLSYLGYYIHFLVMIAGFAVLLYMTFNIKHPKVLLFLISLSVLTLMLAKNEFVAFYLLSTIYLAFITAYFLKNYLCNKKKLSLIVAVAFSLLFLGSFQFFLSISHPLFFIFAYVIELIAYILIAANLYLVQKK